MSSIDSTQVRSLITTGLLFSALLLSACSGSNDSGSDTKPNNPGSTGDTDSGGTDSGGTDPGGTDSGGTDSGGTDSGGSDSGDVADTTASATLPQVDAAGQVSWPFAPLASNVELEIMSFVEMPLADSGKPARWNAMKSIGERLFVSSEIDGKIVEITGRTPTLWFDVASATQSATGRSLNTDNPWHGGVRGFAFHPNFNSNGKFYVSMLQDRPANPAGFTYISDTSGIAADSVLVEWSANPSTFVVDANSYREVFRVGLPEYDHPIKQIEFNPYAKSGQEDYGLLYIAHGDGHAEESTAGGGEGNNALGKILRINPLQSGSNSYSIPSSNPFIGDNSMTDEVFSIGHRNPHHLAFLPDGRLLATESGRDNLDEVNLVEIGANYGWSQREGAFVHLENGTLVNGISALPEDDAANNFTYPVIQYGHTGLAGSDFVGQALGGGFMINNGSALDDEFFYVDFVSSGRMFHSSHDSILASQTTGEPSLLSMAQTFEARVMFDHDGNPDTAAISNTLPEVLQSTGSYDGSGRVDIRIGQGPLGEMYLMNKRNNVIYLVRNSYPPGQAIPTAPVLSDVPAFTRVNFDITVPVYVSNALQVRLVWGDKDINAGWVVDESWAISEDFPTNTEQRLSVTFADNNGDITLGSYEINYKTGTSESESVQITAAQFDTDIWDNDRDGFSNLTELREGTNPLAEPPTFTTLYNEVLQSCDGCHDESSPSGGLDLTRNNAYTNLVGPSSTRKEGAVFVIPFDPDNSYLVQKMEGAEGIAGRAMYYGGEVYQQKVREWIAGGALNN